MSHLGWYLFSAGGAAACFAVATVWVLASRGSVGSRVCLTAVALFFWIAASDAVPQAIISRLSSGYVPFSADMAPRGRVAVVLLGSAAYQSRDWANHHYAVLDRISATRLLEAERVYALVKPDYILSSGGMTDPNDNYRAAALEMAEVLAQHGIPRDRIVVEAQSRTTHDEAVIVKRMLADRPVDHVILVTSRFHMRRSEGTFRSEGIDVIPAVALESPGFDSWWGSLVPTDKGLQDASLAAHELAGIAVYWFRGWFK